MKEQIYSAISKGILVLALLALCGGLASAAEAERQVLRLKLGGSDVIKTSQPFNRVSLANPAIADVVVLSPREIYIFGKTVGSTSVILWEGDKGKNFLDVVVTIDLISLKEKLHELFPRQDISVYASETGVVLSGMVTGPEVVEEALRLTSMFLPKAAGGEGQGTGAGRSTYNVTNLLRVAGAQQVMLEVKFAEVNRTTGMDMQAGIGLDSINDKQRWGMGTGPLGVTGTDVTGTVSGFSTSTSGTEATSRATSTSGVIAEAIQSAFVSTLNGAVTTGSLDSTSLTTTTALATALGNLTSQKSSSETTRTMPTGNPLGTMLINFAGNTLNASGANAANIFINIDKFTAALQLLETEGLARILAEPRLVTMSGREASFLAGGEFPIPVVNNDGSISLVFKEFGVGLSFTPVVLSDGRISLRVAPSVSHISDKVPGPQGAVYPVFTTRKLETSVELFDGQTLALAGLLQENLSEQVRKIPGLGDIPILGALFRSTSYSEKKTDLLIAVTPHLVTPVPEGSLRFPGEDIQRPSRYEFYLEGRLEGRRSLDAPSALSNHNFSALPAGERVSGGLEGDFGHRAPGSAGSGAAAAEPPRAGQGAVGFQQAPN